VIALKESGYSVVYSHIWHGQDFFRYEPAHYDIIVSNPPFTRKLEVLERLYQLDCPFAVLLGLPILNYQVIGEFFVGKDLQLLIVDKKVSFDGNTSSFNTSYFCRALLDRDIVFHHIEHNNSGKDFTKSRMQMQLERIKG